MNTLCTSVLQSRRIAQKGRASRLPRRANHLFHFGAFAGYDFRMKRKSGRDFDLWAGVRDQPAAQRCLGKHPDNRTRPYKSRRFFSGRRLVLTDRKKASDCTVIRIPFNRPFVAGHEIHCVGVGCEMEAIIAIARARKVTVVEDNAHGLYGKYRGRNLDTLARRAKAGDWVIRH